MHSIVALPVLILLAGCLACAPAVQDASRRFILFWIVVPSLLFGAAAFCWRFGGL